MIRTRQIAKARPVVSLSAGREPGGSQGPIDVSARLEGGVRGINPCWRPLDVFNMLNSRSDQVTCADGPLLRSDSLLATGFQRQMCHVPGRYSPERRDGSLTSPGGAGCARRDTCGDAPGYVANSGGGPMRALVSQPSWWGESTRRRAEGDEPHRTRRDVGPSTRSLQNGRAFFTYVNVSFSFSYFSS